MKGTSFIFYLLYSSESVCWKAALCDVTKGSILLLLIIIKKKKEEEEEDTRLEF